MAKKKHETPVSVKLTDEQIGKLTDKLIHSSRNVYTLAESMFGVKVGDEVFEQLKAGEGGIFKCDECNEWLPNDMRDQGMECDFCYECVTEMNDEGDED